MAWLSRSNQSSGCKTTAKCDRELPDDCLLYTSLERRALDEPQVHKVTAKGTVAVELNHRGTCLLYTSGHSFAGQLSKALYVTFERDVPRSTDELRIYPGMKL